MARSKKKTRGEEIKELANDFIKFHHEFESKDPELYERWTYFNLKTCEMTMEERFAFNLNVAAFNYEANMNRSKEELA